MPRRVTEFGNPIYDDCGEYSGFQRHRRYNTLTCRPCTEARNKWMRDYRHRNGLSSGTWVYVPDEIEQTADHYSI